MNQRYDKVHTKYTNVAQKQANRRKRKGTKTKTPLTLFRKRSVEWLDCPFLEEEIHNAVLHLNKEKTIGPVGFTISFYQECWETIKDNLLRVF